MARTDVIGRYLAEVDRALAGGGGALVEELEGHLEDAVARHRAAGLGAQEAMRKAVRDCGTTRDLVAAVAANSEREESMMTSTKWTGLAGVAAVPAAISGMMFWHPATFVLTLGLAAAAIVGLLARHWAYGRREILAAVGLFAAGNVVATLNPVGSAHLLYTVGIPAACTLASVVLVCLVMLRGDAVPAVAVLLILGGVGIMIGINVAVYVMSSAPPYLAGFGGAAAVAGWIWTNGALAIRGARPTSPAAA